MATLPVGIYNPATLKWQQIFDFTRRQGASSVQVSVSDAIIICLLVSSRMWTAHPWQFTLTEAPEIPCVNGKQNYPMPSDCYRLVKSWLRYPQPVCGSSNTVPPFDDPACIALYAALQSQHYVREQDRRVDSPRFFYYPLDVVKTLDNNLYPTTAQRIKAITQIGNSGSWRLSSAAYVPEGQPFSLFGQYQPLCPKLLDMGAFPWFPDQYMDVAQAGILFYLYQANGDPRAGAASYQNGNMAYSGQLAVFMAAIEAAAQEEREGSVDTFVPQDQLGSGFAGQGIWIP